MADERKGSVNVFESIWRQYLKDADEPEFNEQQRLFAERKNEALSQILPPPPSRILECGSGSGEVSAWLAANGYDVVLLDASRSALAFAEKRFQREGLSGKFVHGNVLELPFDDASFDVVTSFGLLEHFEDVDSVLTEMIRVIRPGGMLFADIVPDRFSVQTLGNAFNAIVRVAYYTLKLKPMEGISEAKSLFRPDFYENSYTAEQYLNILERAGLQDVKLFGNRPFPGLTLPDFAERIYVFLMRALMPFWRRFDKNPSAFGRWFGAGWWAWGEKKL
jgi:ubiquinone/menaquinone biosynthesis C-methylase UbiE